MQLWAEKVPICPMLCTVRSVSPCVASCTKGAHEHYGLGWRKGKLLHLLFSFLSTKEVNKKHNTIMHNKTSAIELYFPYYAASVPRVPYKNYVQCACYCHPPCRWFPPTYMTRSMFLVSKKPCQRHAQFPSHLQ